MGFQLPECLQAAYRRRPRRPALAPAVQKENSQNNYLAETVPQALHEMHSIAGPDHPVPVLGGRNAKGAGAPRGNRNAAGGAHYRLRLKRMLLKKQCDQQRYQLLVLAAAIAHLEVCVASSPQPIFPQNNYLAEGGAPATAPLSPFPLAL